MLTTLPEELIDRILSFTCQSTLASVTAVSTLLHRIATPHLYTHVVLTQKTYPRIRSLALLLFTSARHRELVRSLTIAAPSTSACTGTTSVRNTNANADAQLAPWPPHPRLDEILRDQVSRFVSRAEKREEWFNQLRWGCQGMVVAGLAVKVCPIVGELRWDEGGAWVVVRDEKKLEVGEAGWVKRELERRARFVEA